MPCFRWRWLAVRACRELIFFCTLAHGCLTKASRVAASIDGAAGVPTRPEDDLYDDKMTLLDEYIDRQVKEEREQIFESAQVKI